jgi:hypothetical protein
VTAKFKQIETLFAIVVACTTAGKSANPSEFCISRNNEFEKVTKKWCRKTAISSRTVLDRLLV